MIIYEDVFKGRIVATATAGIADGPRLQVTTNAVVDVDPGDLEDITRKLYQAAEKTPPVMLPRPEIPPDGVFRTAPGDSGLLAEIDDRGVRIRLGPVGVRLPPHMARQFAGGVAVLADEADAEPHPDEVEILAIDICRARTDACIVSDGDRHVARAILRRYRLEARDA